MLYGVMDIGRNIFGLSSHSDRLRPDEFWAVDDVSFEVKRGETLGLIGPNGSGKTTLLKMLNGIFWPDKGKITTKGRVGALIAVGAGFHPMLTGRENVYISGAILGMSKTEVNKRFDAIVDFADIGDFLDSPVKHYSSGMFVRLGFAVAVHCEPDILLVDEVLAVGDRGFQIKCFRKMHELKKRDDVSIVLVSYDENTIRQYTKKSIVLNNGKMLFCGESEDAASLYINCLVREKVKDSSIGGNYFGNGIIKKVTFINSEGKETNAICTGEQLIIDIDYEVERKIINPIFGINFSNSYGAYVDGFVNSLDKVRLPDIIGKGKVRIIVDPCDLPVDVYHCWVELCEEEESNVQEWKDLEQKLIIERPNNSRGLLKLRRAWEVIN